ncbi:MAG: DUF4430 domain-containing protein [Solirubrobacteraceae bacterium]
MAAPASAVDVSVRVEGDTATLVPQTTVTPSSAVKVDKTASGGTTCDGAKGGGALELATGGDWGGKAFAFGGPPSQAIELIKGESHPFSDPSQFWSFSVNNASSPVGVCDYVPQQGDELLFYAACASATTGCFSGEPLDVTGPATATPGASVKVRVDELTSPSDGGAPSRAASAGATVTGGGATATTGADGVATVTLTGRGPAVLTATKGGRVRDEATICVTETGPEACAGVVPGDPAAPVSMIRDIAEQQRFAHGRGPRRIRGVVTDASALSSVALSLTRSHRGRCTAFDGARGRFRRARCRRHPRFSIGTAKTFSRLLPRRLGPGRYVADVVSTDGAANREGLFRGRNRIVFYVR